jgi:hypothetical protein
MTAELLLFLVGAALIFVAVFAGRREARAIGLARVGRTLRGAVAGVGVLCVVAALILTGSDDSVAPAGPVRVAIVDELGSGQVSERIRVFLDGRDLGVVKVDRQTPKARLIATVPAAGRYDYVLQAVRQLQGHQPTKISNKGDVVIDGESSRLDMFSDSEGKSFLVPER